MIKLKDLMQCKSCKGTSVESLVIPCRQANGVTLIVVSLVERRQFVAKYVCCVSNVKQSSQTTASLHYWLTVAAGLGGKLTHLWRDDLLDELT